MFCIANWFLDVTVRDGDNFCFFFFLNLKIDW